MNHTTTKEIEELNRAVQAEIGRCLIHLETGIFGQRCEQIHARFTQILPIIIDSENCDSLGIEMHSEGLTLVINPHYFLNTLKTTPERTAALRHVEQHLFLSHPIRLFKHSWQDFKVDTRLFLICAELEVGLSLSSHASLIGLPKAHHYEILDITSMMSAETLVLRFKTLWQETLHAYHQNSLNPDFSSTSNPKQAQVLLELAQYTCPCDQRRWLKSRVEHFVIDDWQVSLLKMDLDRRLLTARESLKIQELANLHEEDRNQVDGLGETYQLSCAQNSLEDLAKLQAQTEQEVETIIVQMLIKDPFFGRYLSACTRQITTAIPTAGVGLYKDYYALLVNPDFFMNRLKSRAERGAVLKHEALHIILKHITQIRRSHINHKQLYNIAADLEVNQYIGSPWSLPNDAITLKSFPDLKLPPHDVAETYYRLLLKKVDSGKISMQELCQRDESRSSSNHDGWSNHGYDTKKGNIASPLPVSDEEISRHELAIEQQVQTAVNATSSKDRGLVPGSILNLLDQWKELRKPQVDWKRELRLFVTTHPSYQRKHTQRKVNRRYVRIVRQALNVHKLTADALLILARRDPELLPKLIWEDLTQFERSEAIKLRPQLAQLQRQAPLPWNQLPRITTHQLHQRLTELDWPTWNQLLDQEIHQLGLLREPLNLDQLPSDLLVVISREYPELLAPLSWDILGQDEQKRLVERYEHLKRITQLNWRLLPTDEVAKLTQSRPDLFPLTWRDVPPQLIAQMPYYQISGNEVFRISRILKKSLPGLTRERDKPSILAIIDTSGSVSDDEINQLFDEIDGMSKISPKVYILQVDAAVQLFYEYQGERPVAGRGGTCFEAGFKWLLDARRGILTPTLRDGQVTQEIVQVKVDGVIYLTDGYASCPESIPYCRTMWVLTQNSSDAALRDWTYTSKIIKLPPRSLN